MHDRLPAMVENTFDLIVIGGGIVGLATAMEVTRRFPALRLAVLEKEARLAAHQSGQTAASSTLAFITALAR